jgi:hypothetical protein
MFWDWGMGREFFEIGREYHVDGVVEVRVILQLLDIVA